MEPLISSADAWARIAAGLPRCAPEQIVLNAALGRILAAPLVADRPLPPFRRATMDGIAFRRSDIETPHLKIAGLHAAGDPPPRRLAEEEAWEIMTGAAVPDDCDLLVPYEEVELEENGTAHIRGSAEPGRFIHAQGSDAREGDILVPAGARIGAVEIAIAASIGMNQVEVFGRSPVSILTTGDEAVAGDPEPWQIRRSHGAMLGALLARSGYREGASQHVQDDAEALGVAVDAALATGGLMLLCGGISKGKRDHVREVVESRLGPPAFHGVLQRPGKPLAFWPGATPVFALPGNPVSVLATFTRYVAPALARMESSDALSRYAPLAQAIARLPAMTWFLPGRFQDDGRILPLPPSNSGDFVSIAGATHFLEIPPGHGTLSAGSSVEIRPI